MLLSAVLKILRHFHIVQLTHNETRWTNVQADLGAYVISPGKHSDSPKAQLLPSGWGRKVRPEVQSSLDAPF